MESQKKLTLEQAQIDANSSDNVIGVCGGKGGCNQQKGAKTLSATPGPGKFVPKKPTDKAAGKIDN